MRRTLDPLENERFDLVVIGGGITGAGVALDAVLRGLRVALVERGDFASGTSSISSKLVHGGLRYLEQGQLGLVREALHERRRLLRNAPHLVWPVRFVVPFYAGARVPGWKFRLGMLLYDVLAGPGNLWRSRACSRSALRRLFPELVPEGLQGGAGYADAQMDDARLCVEVIRTAAEQGAVIANYVEAVGFDGPGVVRAVDRLGGRDLRLSASVVLNAAGPWADRVRRLAGEEDEPLLAPTKGVHVVAPDRGLPAALLLLHPRDGRVFFVLPWLGKTLIGTTDTECGDGLDALSVSDADIDYLLEGYDHHFRPSLCRADLIGHFVGARPLVRSRPGDPSARSREYHIVQGRSGLITVVGGKFTTYRAMAEKITDLVTHRLGRWRPCRTRTWPLDGTPAGPWADFEREAVPELIRRSGLSETSARHLVRRYGRRAGEVARYALRDPALAGPVVEGEPDLRAELAYQREHEMAVLPEDSLLRRTRLGLFHPALLVGK